MSNLKNPFISLDARGTIGKAISFVKRRGQNIAEKTPIPKDARTSHQLAWRTMYQLCVDLWHTLSAAEKLDWESTARPRHMTGYAWYLSQCLRPNPGIYLPLLGGTMQGEIDMDDFHIGGLVDPTTNDKAARKGYVDALFALATFTQGARVYHNADQSIPNITPTALAFNSENYDTDTIHDNVAFNSRLTCKTAGKYLIVLNISWEHFAAGYRRVWFRLNGVTVIAENKKTSFAGSTAVMPFSTIYNLAITDFVETLVWQNRGGAALVLARANYSPAFMMQRIGT